MEWGEISSFYEHPGGLGTFLPVFQLTFNESPYFQSLKWDSVDRVLVKIGLTATFCLDKALFLLPKDTHHHPMRATIYRGLLTCPALFGPVTLPLPFDGVKYSIECLTHHFPTFAGRKGGPRHGKDNTSLFVPCIMVGIFPERHPGMEYLPSTVFQSGQA